MVSEAVLRLLALERSDNLGVMRVRKQVNHN
jgi:hypothetical protein